MRAFKEFVKKILRLISKDLESYVVDYLYIRKFNRRSPELMWRIVQPGSYEMYDAGGVQLKDKMYIFGGYDRLTHIHSKAHVLDLRSRKWSEQFDMPQAMAQSHQGIACDGERYIYEISGQLGDQCHPAVRECFVYDTLQKIWESFMPSLPQARYAATAQYWNGRLHVVGGSKEDRNTPSTDHLSIAVDNGKAIENDWRSEPAIPRGGPHRASTVIDNNLYVFGGQEGDYIAIPGDAKYTCTGQLTNEIVYSDVYMLPHDGQQWKKLKDMPVKVSHIEFSTAVIGPYIVIVGGMDNKDPETKVVTLTNVIQVYDSRNDTWTIAGHLPYRLKCTIVAYYEGWLYLAMGQRDKDFDNPVADRYIRQVWRTKFSL